MLRRSLLSLGLVLLAASCVPPALAGQGDGAPAFAAYDARIPDAPAPPVSQAVYIPPPEVIAAAIAPGHAAEPFKIGERPDADLRGAVDCLTAAIYYEARSESEGGQRAVAQVVLNRVRHPAFPKSVCGVVYQGSNRATGCQFSFTCDGSTAHRREPAAWARAQRIAISALAGSVYAPVGLATHFHTTAIHPWWADSMARAVTIGSHIFYRWHGEWGDPKAYRRPYSGSEMANAGGVEGEAFAEASVSVVAGVTIHRGGAAAASAPAESLAAGVRIHRLGASRSVQVHRGAAPGQEAEPAMAAAEGNGEGPVPTR